MCEDSSLVLYSPTQPSPPSSPSLPLHVYLHFHLNDCCWKFHWNSRKQFFIGILNDIRRFILEFIEVNKLLVRLIRVSTVLYTQNKQHRKSCCEYEFLLFIFGNFSHLQQNSQNPIGLKGDKKKMIGIE